MVSTSIPHSPPFRSSWWVFIEYRKTFVITTDYCKFEFHAKLANVPDPVFRKSNYFRLIVLWRICKFLESSFVIHPEIPTELCKTLILSPMYCTSSTRWESVSPRVNTSESINTTLIPSQQLSFQFKNYCKLDSCSISSLGIMFFMDFI